MLVRANRWLAEGLRDENQGYEVVVKRTPQHDRRTRRRRNSDGDQIPTQRDRVLELARLKETITAAELVAIGIHRPTISKLVKEGRLIRVGFGRYRLSVDLATGQPKENEEV